DGVDTGTAFTAYTYDSVGNILTKTDGAGTTTYIYDFLNRLTTQIDPNPDDGSAPTNLGAIPDRTPVTTYSYDADGEVLQVTDPMGVVTTNQYDGLGRLARQVMPKPSDGTLFTGSLTDDVPAEFPYTAYTYDKNGNLKSKADALGNTTTYFYDHLNRLTSQVDPLGNVDEGVPEDHTTAYTYDQYGNRTTLTDPTHNVTIWTYDSNNRPSTESIVTVAATETDPAQYATRSYEYDADGNLQKVIDRDGRKTTYTYDGMNRRINEQWFANDADTTADYAIGYAYNADGTMASTSAGPAGGSSDASYSYDYYGDARVQNTHMNLANLAPPVTIARAYDDTGNMIALKGTLIGLRLDFFNNYTYDHLNRLTDVVQYGFADGFLGLSGTVIANKYIHFEYNNAGQFLTIDRAGDSGVAASSAYTYDANGRLTGLRYADASDATLENYGWTIDTAGRITQFTNQNHTSEGLSYTYDAAGQLTNYQTSTTGNSITYDDNGNRTSTTYSVAGLGGTHTYSTNAYNEVLTDGIFSYSYDLEGNLTQKTQLVSGAATGETKVFTWDHRNRLTSVTDYASASDAAAHATPNWTVTYKYDMFNNMVGRQVVSNVGSVASTSENYVYDDGQIVLKLADNATVQDRYLWAPAVDMLLAQEDASNNVLWALDDNLNSIRDWVDSSGAVASHRTYDAFGTMISATGSVDTVFGWTGRYDDPLTKLQYNTNRWYDSNTGRWISQDPIGFDGDLSNLYRYVFNSPTNYADPSGLIWDTVWDVASIVYDAGKITVGMVTDNPALVTDGSIDLAADTVALLIPFAPAGATKAARIMGKGGTKVAKEIIEDGTELTIKQTASRAKTVVSEGMQRSRDQLSNVVKLDDLDVVGTNIKVTVKDKCGRELVAEIDVITRSRTVYELKNVQRIGPTQARGIIAQINRQKEAIGMFKGTHGGLIIDQRTGISPATQQLLQNAGIPVYRQVDSQLQVVVDVIAP
ncbi:MAG: RHS repeat-associated core domain-containing protein, partial [Singulisphaera sp.]